MNATNDIRALHAKAMKTGCATTATIKVNGQKCLVKVSPPKDGQQQVHVSTLRAPLGMRECSQTEFTYDEKHIGEQLGKFSEKIIEAEINAMCEKTISTSKDQKNSLMINDRKCEVVTGLTSSGEAYVVISYTPPDSQKRYHACEFMHKRGESLAEHIAEASKKVLQIEVLPLLLGAKANGIESIVAPIVERFHQPIAEKELDVRMGEIGTILENIRTFAGQNPIWADGLSVLKTVLDKLVGNKEMIQGSNGNFSINDCSDPACRKVALQVEGLQLLCDELLVSSLGVNNVIASIAKRLHQPILEEEMDMRMGQIETILGDVETFMTNPMSESSIATLKTALGKLVDNKKMIQRSNGNSSINECDSPACRKVALQVEELQSLLDIKADKIDSVISLITECYCAFDSLHSAESYVGGKMELIRINLEGVMAFVERAFMRQENSQMGSVGKIVERARISAKRTFAWQKPLSETSLSALRKAMAQLASKANIIQLPNGNSSINGCDNLVCRKVASRIEELQLLLYAKANKIDGAVAPIIECLYKRIPESQIDAQAKEIEKMLEKVRIFVQQNPMPEDDMLILKTTLDRLANNKDMIHFEDNYNCSISDYKYNCFSCYDVLSQIEDLQVLLSAKISGIGDIVTPIIERLYQPISQKEIDAQMRKIGIMLEDIKTAVQQNSISKKGMSALETALNKLAYKNGVIQWNYSIDSHINIPSCRQVIWQIKELKSMLELPYTKAVATTRQNVEYDQQRIAAEMASECFGASGKIDLGKARELRDRIKSFTVLPKKFSTIPGASLMLSQVSCVLDNLIDHAQETGNLREIIDRANELSPGNHGRQILNIMGDDLKSPVKPGEAILISLFSLHRQKGLSSCATSSIINAELRNHPERIAKILEQILAGSTFNLPSGHPIHQQQIVGGNGRYYIPANLATGDNAQRDEIFAQENLYDYLAAGIERDSSNPYGLLLPVRNLTDVLFANFFQASEFGNKYLSIKDDLEHGTAFIYYGARDNNSVYSKQGISVAGTDFKAGMERLKRAAEEQKARGMHYMRVATENMAWDMWNHTENIDIDALLKLDLDALKIGKPHIIGDRNWIDEKGRPVFLAIVKIITPASNRPIYSFQSVSSGEPTEKEDVLRFDVYQPL